MIHLLIQRDEIFCFNKQTKPPVKEILQVMQTK